MQSYLVHINLSGLKKSLKAFFILLSLQLILLNSLNIFSLIISDGDALADNKSEIESLLENFIKNPESKSESSKDSNESESEFTLSCSPNICLFFSGMNINERMKSLSHSFYGNPPSDITTPPPKFIS